MSALNYQKDLIAYFKREVLSNTSILTKVYPMNHDLSRHIFKEDALEKPTQHMFIHLSYYLVCLIDSQRSKLITWPLYDTKAEKNYKKELAFFVAQYHELGLLAPVISSYFVNPGCFKVVKLLYQLSHLAVQHTLNGRLTNQSQSLTLYEDITNKYKSVKEDFVPIIEKETAKLLNSFSKFMQQKKMIEDTIIAILNENILENEKKLASIKDQMLIDDLIDSFIETTKLNSEHLNIMLELKKNKYQQEIFDIWLEQTDCFLTEMDNGWNKKFTKVVELAESCRSTSQTLIARQTGDADKKQYSIEFNNKTDVIQTSPLKAEVSVQQKYILKNIIIRDKLHFPMLIRAYLISISHILNGVDLADDLDGFNIAMECEAKNYEEVIMALKALIDRIYYAEGRLLPQPLRVYNTSINMKNFTNIPLFPDLSDLKTTRDLPFQSAFESFTPLTLFKHQFNFKKRYANSRRIFVAPQPKLFATPANAPQKDFLKTIQSCKMSSFDKTNRTQNISIISEAAKRVNETIADCNTGFTKQQIQRLLSTKKGSTTKKHKFNLDRPRMNIKKGGLFNDTADASMARSYSSPDLFANKKNKRQQLLSVMQEDIPALLEVSGISIIRNDSDCNMPNNHILSEPSPNVFDVPNTPTITISPVKYTDNDCDNHILKTDLDDNIVQTQQEIEFSADKANMSKLKIFEEKSILEEFKSPQNINRPSRKSKSIEKIINRFRKIKANILNETNNDLSNCSIIREEKENNLNAVNVNLLYTKTVETKKLVVPDLLRPNYKNAADESNNSELNEENDSFKELCLGFEEKGSRKERQSLGAALGVDNKILDQFELFD